MRKQMEEMGCALNAFSLEYDDALKSADQIAMAGESYDRQAQSTTRYIDTLEAVCDKLHEQVLFCGEARRVLCYAAAYGLYLTLRIRQISSKKSVSLNADPTSGGPSDEMKMLEMDKRRIEGEHETVLRTALSECARCKRDVLGRVVKGALGLKAEALSEAPQTPFDDAK